MTKLSVSRRHADMPSRQRRAEAGSFRQALHSGGPAAFLLAAILLGGGSAHGLVSYALLQALSVLCLLYIVFRPKDLSPLQLRSGLAWLLIATLALIAFHLLPLPPSLWTRLAGRGEVVEGYRLLEQPLPWLPITLDPARGLSSALGLLPALCAFLLVLRASRAAYFPLALMVLAAGLLSIVLGIGQVTGGPSSPLYLYRITNRDSAVGFFANANHLATLLLIGIPLAAAASLHVEARKPQLTRAYILALAGAGAAFLVLGLFIVGSVAGVLLAPPVLLASAALLGQRRARRGLVIGGLGAVLLLGAAGAITSMSARAPTFTTSIEGGQFDRIGIARQGWDLVRAYAPVGAGIGAFQPAYQAHEQLDRVTNRYINHAHNDYLEVLIEAGIPAAMLVAAFVLWWLRRSFAAWADPGEGSYWRQAASICIGVVILHSLVDYPARTGAIEAIVGAMCAILAKRETGANQLAA